MKSVNVFAPKGLNRDGDIGNKFREFRQEKERKQKMEQEKVQREIKAKMKNKYHKYIYKGPKDDIQKKIQEVKEQRRL